MPWSESKRHKGLVININHMILIGFKYLASSIPIIAFTGVAIGVGLIFALLLFSISRNPSISCDLWRRAGCGDGLAEGANKLTREG